MEEQLPQNDLINVFFFDHAGPRNRGCEAILRSFEGYLREHYGPHNLLVGSSSPGSDRKHLSDIENAVFVPLVHPNRSLRGFLGRLCRRLGAGATSVPIQHAGFWQRLRWADGVFDIGGDSIGMHYGGPWRSLEFLRCAKALGKVAAVQAHSIGPFEGEKLTRYAVDVLGRLDLVCARESISYRYLRQLGLENVKLVADPAFLLPAQPVRDAELPDGRPTIGVGLSHGFPLYLGISSKEYLRDSIELVNMIHERTDASVALLPHQFKFFPSRDDYWLSEKLAHAARRKDRLWMLPHRQYNCMQLKYLIGRCDTFISARTHATIAGLSQGVPTLTFTYSVKSRGIFQDVYGHEDYVLTPDALHGPEAAERICDVFARRRDVRREMAQGIQVMKQRARLNGDSCVSLLKTCRRSRG